MTKPPAVGDEEEYWSRPPPTPSTRCEWWQTRIAGGWVPNRRLSGMGYHTAACWYGVYIWELINVLRPAIDRARAARGEPGKP